jgi:hypothetical protein
MVCALTTPKTAMLFNYTFLEVNNTLSPKAYQFSLHFSAINAKYISIYTTHFIDRSTVGLIQHTVENCISNYRDTDVERMFRPGPRDGYLFLNIYSRLTKTFFDSIMV